jgi:hypothetical protein
MYSIAMATQAGATVIKPVRVFISYSHLDEKLRRALDEHLSILENEGLVSFWSDQKLDPGSSWKGKIHSEFEGAELILLLVSASFLNSDYCRDVEAKRALVKHGLGEASVIPIILRPSSWQTSELSHLQALPSQAKPVTKWKNRDEALQDITEGIRKLIIHKQESQFLAHSSHTPSAPSTVRRPSAASPIEKEIKFEGLGNTQLKFVATESAEVVMEKLRVLSNLLRIRMGEIRHKTICDEYFDDQTQSLRKNACSFRRRNVEGDLHAVTFKRKLAPATSYALQRSEKEFDCNENEFRHLLRDPFFFNSRFAECLTGLKVPSGPLSRIMTIQNLRTKAELETDCAKYEFCYDRYYYVAASRGIYSEKFTEIEIELRGHEPSADKQLEMLTENIRLLFGHHQHGRSKLDRGLEWLENPHGSTGNVCAIALEIIGFSQKNLDDQKQALQSLSHHTKHAIKDLHGETVGESIVCIPTGSGFVLLFDDYTKPLLPVIAEIQQRVKLEERRGKTAANFSFRTGMHVASVFKFTDATGNLNYAGEAIHVAQQVMRLGSEWHILATGAAYQQTQISRRNLSVGWHSIEQDRRIELFNLHEHSHESPDKSYGYPGPPSDMFSEE